MTTLQTAHMVKRLSPDDNTITTALEIYREGSFPSLGAAQEVIKELWSDGIIEKVDRGPGFGEAWVMTPFGHEYTDQK